MRLAKMVKDMYMQKYAMPEVLYDDEQGSPGSALDLLQTFDLVVEYTHVGGGQVLDPQTPAFKRIFRDCYLTGEEQTVSATAGVGNDLSSSAQPILEIYPFFCKTIITEPRYE